MQMRLLAIVPVLLLSLELVACAGLETASDTKPKAELESKPTVLLDRYELHEIRNGPFNGTALLDKETGRVWTLATTSKGTSVTSVEFDAALVIPVPESELCPPNDPLGLFQPQTCTPRPGGQAPPK